MRKREDEGEKEEKRLCIVVKSVAGSMYFPLQAYFSKIMSFQKMVRKAKVL